MEQTWGAFARWLFAGLGLPLHGADPRVVSLTHGLSMLTKHLKMLPGRELRCLNQESVGRKHPIYGDAERLGGCWWWHGVVESAKVGLQPHGDTKGMSYFQYHSCVLPGCTAQQNPLSLQIYSQDPHFPQKKHQ